MTYFKILTNKKQNSKIVNKGPTVNTQSLLMIIKSSIKSKYSNPTLNIDRSTIIQRSIFTDDYHHHLL